MNPIKPSMKALKLAKDIAHEIWAKYDDKYNYRSEKQKRNDLVSISNPENMYFFWQQFDSRNQTEFGKRLYELPDSPEKQELIDWILQWTADTLETIGGGERN